MLAAPLARPSGDSRAFSSSSSVSHAELLLNLTHRVHIRRQHRSIFRGHICRETLSVTINKIENTALFSVQVTYLLSVTVGEPKDLVKHLTRVTDR